MNTKVDEGKLISGKEALIALANGEEVEYVPSGMAGTKYWSDSEKTKNFTIHDFYSGYWVFRLKPRTITLNGIEVPAPFEPKCGDMVWCLSELSPSGYEARTAYEPDDFFSNIGYWRTEEEIKQVVAALRQVFGGSHDN